MEYLRRDALLAARRVDHVASLRIEPCCFEQPAADTAEVWLSLSVVELAYMGITGVSVGPVLAYGPPRTADPLLREFGDLGACAIDTASAENAVITRIHPSCEIDATDAELLSLQLSRRYMNADQYFRLKQFSYYPRDYGRDDFDHDVTHSDLAELPFRIRDDGLTFNELGTR